MPDQKCVTLDNLAGGGARELFDTELLRVLKNIEDVNTVAGEKRKITLEVIITPNEERDMGIVKVQCTSKLAGPTAVKAVFFLGRDNRHNPVAIERDPAQLTFDDIDHKTLRPIEGGKA